MKDDAVAPVVAVMLILGIVVTVVAYWNATCLPSLKEQAEIEHIGDVEESFLAIGAAMETGASLDQAFSIKEAIALGGGDIILNSLKSGGTLQVREEGDWLFNITNGTDAPVVTRMINISYHPVGNFWVDQGYNWQYGYVNVTNTVRETPLSYTTMEELESTFANATGGLPCALIDIEGRGSPHMVINTTDNVTVVEEDTYVCTGITVSAVNFSAGASDFVSGNGVGTLSLQGTVTTAPANLTDTLMITANPDLPLPYDEKILAHCLAQFEELNSTYDNICEVSQPDAQSVRLVMDDQVNITVRMLQVEVSAY